MSAGLLICLLNDLSACDSPALRPPEQAKGQIDASSLERRLPVRRQLLGPHRPDLVLMRRLRGPSHDDEVTVAQLEHHLVPPHNRGGGGGRGGG